MLCPGQCWLAPGTGRAVGVPQKVPSSSFCPLQNAAALAAASRCPVLGEAMREDAGDALPGQGLRVPEQL